MENVVLNIAKRMLTAMFTLAADLKAKWLNEQKAFANNDYVHTSRQNRLMNTIKMEKVFVRV